MSIFVMQIVNDDVMKLAMCTLNSSVLDQNEFAVYVALSRLHEKLDCRLRRFLAFASRMLSSNKDLRSRLSRWRRHRAGLAEC
jgi:hypothetical protein